MKKQRFSSNSKLAAGWILLFILLIYCSYRKNENSIDVHENRIETNTTIQDKENEDNIIWPVDKSMNNVQKGRLLYQKYCDRLINNDRLRENISVFSEDGWRNVDNGYRELLDESYFGQVKSGGSSSKSKYYMEGILAAERGRENSDAFYSMRIAIKEGGGILEYRYCDTGEILYISCRGLKNMDIPEYQMCDNSLIYSDIDPEDATGKDMWKERLERLVQEGNDNREYCVINNRLYEINREEETLQDITEEIEYYMARWLIKEAERVYFRMKITSEVKETIKKLLPEDYSLSKHVAVCDLNHDGWEDYLAVVFRNVDVQKADKNIFSDSSELWLLLSEGDGSYKKKVLLDGGVVCEELRFEADGLLMFENIYGYIQYGKIPRRIDYFLYDSQTESFRFNRAMWINQDRRFIFHDRKTVGELNIYTYYKGIGTKISGFQNERYNIKSDNDREVYITSMYQYMNADQTKEQWVNEKLLQIENICAWNALSLCDETAIYVGSEACYVTPDVFTGSVYVTPDVFGGKFPEYPFMLDIRSKEILEIQDLISKEQIISLCEQGIKDVNRMEMSEENRKKFLQILEGGYERANYIDKNTEENGGMYIYICFTPWGVSFRGKEILSDGTCSANITCMADKELFYNTRLWQYLKPEGYVVSSLDFHFYQETLREAQEESLPVSSDISIWNQKIKKYLNMSVQDILAIAGSESLENGSLVVFEPDIFFPVIVLPDEFLIVLCSSLDGKEYPRYITFSENYKQEYLLELGLDQEMKFQDIMEVMGKTEPEMSGAGGSGTNYRIAYETDGLMLEFISDYADGHAFDLFIY